MTENVLTVTSADTIETCMEIMTQKHPAPSHIEESKALGMISIGDVVNAIIKTQKETIEHLKSYIAQ